MIAFPPGARVWLAGGVTDMRKGMNGLTLLVQEGSGATRMPATSSSFGAAAATW